MFEFKLNVSSQITSKAPRQRNFYKANYNKINNFLLTVNWSNIFYNPLNINETYSKFIAQIHNSIQKFVKNRESCLPSIK